LAVKKNFLIRAPNSDINLPESETKQLARTASSTPGGSLERAAGAD